MWKMLLFKNKK